MEYEQIFLRGIPFLKGSDDSIYNYNKTNPIRIGKYSSATGELSLDADCASKLESSLAEWRSKLVPSERGQIKPEAKLKKSSGPRKNSRRAGGAGAKAEDSTSEEE